MLYFRFCSLLLADKMYFKKITCVVGIRQNSFSFSFAMFTKLTQLIPQKVQTKPMSSLCPVQFGRNSSVIVNTC